MNREAYSFHEIYFDPLDGEGLAKVLVPLDSLGSKHLAVGSFSNLLEESVLRLLIISLSADPSGALETTQTPDVTEAGLLFQWLSWACIRGTVFRVVGKLTKRTHVFLVAYLSPFSSSECVLKFRGTELRGLNLLRINRRAETRKRFHGDGPRSTFLRGSIFVSQRYSSWRHRE